MNTNYGCFRMIKDSRPIVGNKPSRIEVNSKNFLNKKNTKINSTSIMQSNESLKSGKQLDLLDLCGDIEINIWNNSKSKKVVSFFCQNDSELLEKNQKKINGRISQNINCSTTISEVTVKIFEDKLGKREYKMFIDTKNCSEKITQNLVHGKKIEWTGGKKKSKFVMNMSSGKENVSPSRNSPGRGNRSFKLSTPDFTPRNQNKQHRGNHLFNFVLKLLKINLF